MNLNYTDIHDVKKLHEEFDPLLEKYEKSIKNDILNDNRNQLSDFKKIYYANYDSYENLVRLLEETYNNSHFLQNIGVKSISFEEKDRRREKFFDGGRRYDTQKQSEKFTQEYKYKSKEEYKKEAYNTVENPFATFFSGMGMWMILSIMVIVGGLLFVVISGIYNYIKGSISYFSQNQGSFAYFILFIILDILYIRFGKKFGSKYYNKFREKVFEEGKYLYSFLAYASWYFLASGIMFIFLLLVTTTTNTHIYDYKIIGGILTLLLSIGFFTPYFYLPIAIILSIVCIVRAFIYRKSLNA